MRIYKKPHGCFKSHKDYLEHNNHVDYINNMMRDEWNMDGKEDDMRREAQDYIDLVGYVGI